MAALSYVSGLATVSLLGQTIGENLAATVAQLGAREALVDVPSGRRWTYDELADDVEAVAKGLLALGIAKGDRVGIWAPNVPEWVLVQFATARIGAILVNINPAYRSHELCLRAQTGRHPHAGRGRVVQDLGLPRHGRRGARRLPGPERRHLHRHAGLGRLDRRRLWNAGRAARRSRGAARVRRPDQHPVHVRHHRLPQGRHALAPQHPQQRLLRRPRTAVDARTTESSCRCRSTTASAW